MTTTTAITASKSHKLGLNLYTLAQCLIKIYAYTRKMLPCHSERAFLLFTLTLTRSLRPSLEWHTAEKSIKNSWLPLGFRGSLPRLRTIPCPCQAILYSLCPIPSRPVCVTNASWRCFLFLVSCSSCNCCRGSTGGPAWEFFGLLWFRFRLSLVPWLLLPALFELFCLVMLAANYSGLLIVS